MKNIWQMLLMASAVVSTPLIVSARVVVAPSSLQAVATSQSQISLKFVDNSNDERGFVIMRSANSSTGFSQVAKLSANVTSFTNSNLSASKTFYYRVAAFRNVQGKAVYSAYSNIASATTLGSTPSPTPAPTPTPTEPNWVRCATEGGSCAFTGSRSVRYGINGVYVTKTALSGPVSCTNLFFGSDPFPNYLKACDYSAAEVSAPVPSPTTTTTTTLPTVTTTTTTLPAPTTTTTMPPAPTPTLPPAPVPPAGNSMVITDRSGLAQIQYPVQFARPFVQGEIAGFPQVLINGTAVLTQADVKQRYNDGSVKHSLISFVIPSLPANGSVQITFRNQASGNNTALTATEMLAPDYNFDATMEMKSGAAVQLASARRMLQEGKFTYWASGPVATSILLADHSTTAAYDIGFNNYKSIRPIFHATFFPAIKKVRVRFIGENANTTTLQDVLYDLKLSTGSTNPVVQYNKAALPHYLQSRWTKTYWIGGEPEKKINFDHNLSYLKQTRFFPNFDTSQNLSEAFVAQEFSYWLLRPKDLYDKGNWTTYMPTTGGRGDIGLYPVWTMYWLQSGGDWRMRDQALALADLAGAWGLHLREGNSALKFDRAQTLSAVGRPISLNARPNDYIPDNNGVNYLALPTPRIPSPDFPYVSGSWIPDDAHQPDPFSAQYILTGDFFYLEEIQMWAAASAMSQSPYYSRGGVPGRAGIHSQIRGNAWLLRNRMHAAFLTPDTMVAERTLFNEYFNDAVALWEGERNFTGTQFQNDPLWIKGNTDPTFRAKTVSNLGFWMTNCSNYSAENIEGYWQDYFFLSTLGFAKERGFPVGRLLAHHAKVLNGQFSDPGYDPRLIVTYYTPTCDSNNNLFTSFSAIRAALPNQGADTIADFNNTAYAVYAVGAGSFTALEPGGSTAWNWLQSEIREKRNMRSPDAIQFNILPRP